MGCSIGLLNTPYKFNLEYNNSAIKKFDNPLSEYMLLIYSADLTPLQTDRAQWMGNPDKTGTHFEFSIETLESQKQFLKLPLTPREKKFLSAAFAARREVETDIFTAVELCVELEELGMPTTRATIDRYCRKLKDQGIFDSAFRKAGEARVVKRRLWRLRDIGEVEKVIDQKIHAQARKNSNPLRRSVKIAEGNTQYLKTLEGATPRSENFWFGFLDRCMARSSWEDIPGNFMVTPLPFKNERIVIATSTQTNGGRLLAWTDKPVMRALITQILGLIEDRLSEGAVLKELDNAFPIDLVEVAKLMELSQPHNSRNQERIYKSVQALEDTRFDVKLDSDPRKSEFMSFFNLNQVEDGAIRESHFRFIGHIDILDDMDARQVPRHLVVSLGPHLWHRIKNNPTTKAIFRSHREMLTTRVSGVMQVLYDYLRPVIYKTKNKPERTINRPLEHFAATLIPTIDYAEFKQKIIAGLKAQAASKFDDWDGKSFEPMEVLFCGYYVTLFKLEDPSYEFKTKDNLVIQVQRDRKDSIIGDNTEKRTPASKVGPKRSQLSFF